MKYALVKKAGGLVKWQASESRAQFERAAKHKYLLSMEFIP